MDTHWLSAKENVSVATASKDGHANNLLGYKKSIMIDFLEESATVNNASYCQVLRQYFILVNDTWNKRNK